MECRILLSLNLNKEYYIDAVEQCGAIAVAKYCPEVSTDYDGLILCGGNDINPKYYGEEINGAQNIDHERDKVEFALAKAFVEAKKPILGICRGNQLLNVFFGGSLHQDLLNADFHTNKTDFYCSHEVIAEKNTICNKLYGDRFFINSSHHQAINITGENIRITMKTDNVVEGFEHLTLPVWGVQWHPERMCFSQKREDTVDGSEVFKYFIKQCQSFKQKL